MAGLPYPLHPDGSSAAAVPSHAPMPASSMPSSSSASRPSVEAPSFYSDLQNKSVSELEELLRNDSQLNAIIQKYPHLGNMKRERIDAMNKAVTMATENLSQRESLEKAKGDLLTMVDKLNVVRGQLETSMKELEAVKRQHSKDWLMTNLKVAAAEAEESAEAIFSSQVINGAGDVDIDDILRRFMQQKKLCYLRRFKEEKIRNGHVV